ncbi:MAG: glycosyltransferase [Alphaproteobacteria bacterium]|nr:glycosyltransferase [Alphaproteobacteria bacterium]
MKILQVMAGAEHGGAETAFADMCLALHDAGEDIEVVTRPGKTRVPMLEAAGIKVHTLPFGGRIDVYTSWRLQSIIRKFKPDIVQGWMSRACEKIPRWSPHIGAPRYWNVARLGSAYKLKYFKNMDFFVAITPDLKKYLIESGVEESRVVHINNFAEVEPVETPLQRQDFGTPEDAPLLLGLGRLHPAKAFDTLIEVVAALPGVHAWIAGEGPQRGQLEKLIEALGVGDRVKLLGWRTDRAALLQACDICTFISRKEGFGTVFVQSWAQKTPVIVCEAEGPRQYVRHGVDGMVAPIDDVAAIKKCVLDILGDEMLAARLIENGYKRYQDEFTKTACLQAYLQYYHEIRERAE